MIGFDDHAIAEMMDLSTIRQPVAEQALDVTTRLLAAIGSGQEPQGVGAADRAGRARIDRRVAVGRLSGEALAFTVMGELMLIDAANLYFRAFYAIPESVTAPDGRPVNAIRGYLDMSAALIDRRRPRRFVSCLDLSWRPEFRVALVPSYKAHRVAPDGSEAIPDALLPQIPQLLAVLDALGLRCAGAEGFEADDVMATLAARDAATVDVVSGDRDMLALADDRVTVLYAGKGIAKLEEMTPDQVLAKYGVPAAHYPDFAALRGDPSDGLPGVPGVGEKTAAALVARFGRVEDIVTAAERGDDGFPAGAQAKVRAAADYLAVAAARRPAAPRRPVTAHRRLAPGRTGRPEAAGRAHRGTRHRQRGAAAPHGDRRRAGLTPRRSSGRVRVRSSGAPRSCRPST